MQQQSTDTARVQEETTILNLLALGDISIDDEGRVWRHGQRRHNTFTAYPEPRRIDYCAGGYRAVKLTYSVGRRISTSAHRIQWIKHNGSIPDGLEVNHKDLNKENNRIDNLELMTRGDNIRHAREAYGPSFWSMPGEGNPSAKLNWEQVRFIRAEVGAKRATQKKMADRFGVNPALHTES